MSNKWRLPFTVDGFVDSNPSSYDVSIAANLCLRAAYNSLDLEEFRTYVQGAYLILDAFGMAGTQFPDRCKSGTLYHPVVIRFLADNVLTGNAEQPSRKELLSTLRTISQSRTSTDSVTETTSHSKTTTRTPKELLHEEISTSISDGTSTTKTIRSISDSTTISTDGLNIRTSDLLNGYMKLIQDSMSEHFLQFFAAYYRASHSKVFVEQVNYVGSILWQQYLHWWLSAHNTAERQAIIKSAMGKPFEMTPSELFAAEIKIRNHYHSVSGWILEHLAAPYTGRPNCVLLKELVHAADIFIEAGAEDIFATMAKLRDEIARLGELETFYGDSV